METAFAWYLVVSLAGTDDIYVREMPSKAACIKEQNVLLKKGIKRVKDVIDVTCEEGKIIEPETNRPEISL